MVLVQVCKAGPGMPATLSLQIGCLQATPHFCRRHLQPQQILERKGRAFQILECLQHGLVGKEIVGRLNQQNALCKRAPPVHSQCWS